jgi:hypothetical protein
LTDPDYDHQAAFEADPDRVRQMLRDLHRTEQHGGDKTLACPCDFHRGRATGQLATIDWLFGDELGD